MKDLTYGFKQLTQRNRDGSFATQANRMRMLSLFADQLREAGYVNLKKAEQLKGRHVKALVNRWKKEQISSGTIKTDCLLFAGGLRKSIKPLLFIEIIRPMELIIDTM